MFKVTSYLGATAHFQTLAEAVRHIGPDVLTLRGKYGRVRTNDPTWRVRWVHIFGEDKYTVYDECDVIVPVDVLKTKYVNLPKRRPVSYRGWRGRFRCYGYDPKDFRTAPVPHTGHHRWSRWYRRPHTKAERAANDLLLYDEEAIDYNIKARAVRSGYNLRSSWDDIGRNREDNWKRQRKTQWK